MFSSRRMNGRRWQAIWILIWPTVSPISINDMLIKSKQEKPPLPHSIHACHHMVTGRFCVCVPLSVSGLSSATYTIKCETAPLCHTGQAVWGWDKHCSLTLNHPKVSSTRGCCYILWHGQINRPFMSPLLMSHQEARKSSCHIRPVRLHISSTLLRNSLCHKLDRPHSPVYSWMLSGVSLLLLAGSKRL